MTTRKLLKLMAQAGAHVRDIDSDDILHYAGLERRPSALSRAVGAIGIFGAGLVLGAGVGLLFSPMAPEEVRRKISTGARNMKETVSKEISSLVSKEQNGNQPSLSESTPRGSSMLEQQRARNGATGTTSGTTS